MPEVKQRQEEEQRAKEEERQRQAELMASGKGRLYHPQGIAKRFPFGWMGVDL
jgi:hypothetical protein